jgi:hypothetical protein
MSLFICSPRRMKGESVGLSVYSPIVARQRLGKYFPAARKNCWTRYSPFLSLSYENKVGDLFFPEILVPSSSIMKHSVTKLRT